MYDGKYEDRWFGLRLYMRGKFKEKASIFELTTFLVSVCMPSQDGQKV